MTVIRHNSISGIVSITAAAGSNLSFYDSTGSNLSLDTGDINAGVITATTANFTNATVTGDLTVQGTTTTLDTTVTEVDKLEVGANNTTVGVAITQSGTGDILRLYDGASQVVTVKDGGFVAIGTQIEGESGADDLTIATSSTTGITIRSGTSNAGNIYFSDGTSGSDEYRGIVSYVHNEDSLILGTNGSERLRINSSGTIGIGTDDPINKLSILVGNETDLGSGSNGLRIYDGTKNVQLARTGSTYSYGGVTGTGSLIYSYDKLSLLADNNNAITFATGGTERLSILSNGTIRKGSSNGANGKQPIELFFQKRSTQIGKRIHQGSGTAATTHNILNIDSWQSTNSHAFIYVTVYYVSPVSNYGGRMECYAHAVNSGGNVSGGQGTFVTSDAGKWGNPGTPSLSWNGSTLRFTTLAHAYIDYSLDITCIAYDGAVVSFYSN